MLSRLLKTACVIFALQNFPSIADSDFQTWAGLIVQKPIEGRFLSYFEIQNRWHRSSSTAQRLLVRPAVGLSLSHRHTIWLGYGWTPLFSPQFLDEHRLWQQTISRYDWTQWHLFFRFRLEERWIGGDGTAFRWREMFRASFHPYGTWGIVLWDEFFFNMNATPNVPVTGMDQNRLFIGAALPLGQGLVLEPGYMNVYNRKPAGTPDLMAHTLGLYLFWNPDSTPPPLVEKNEAE